MRKDGKSIVIITHKLHEVMAISDRVAVLLNRSLFAARTRTGARKTRSAWLFWARA